VDAGFLYDKPAVVRDTIKGTCVVILKLTVQVDTASFATK